MTSTINAYMLALREIWKKSFGEYHVMSRSKMILKLKKVVDLYYSQVYTKIHQKLERRKSNVGIKI